MLVGRDLDRTTRTDQLHSRPKAELHQSSGGMMTDAGASSAGANGGTQTAGAGGNGGSVAITKSWAFDSGLESWEVRATVPTALQGIVALVWSGDNGDPQPGMLQLVAPFDSAGQSVRVGTSTSPTRRASSPGGAGRRQLPRPPRGCAGRRAAADDGAVRGRLRSGHPPVDRGICRAERGRAGANDIDVRQHPAEPAQDVIVQSLVRRSASNPFERAHAFRERAHRVEHGAPVELCGRAVRSGLVDDEGASV